MLQALGFGPRWSEWVSILFRIATSRALLNGVHGGKFRHARVVHQGDPLSSMLSILAMDPLQRLLDLATSHDVLMQLPLVVAKWRTSMYADDAAIFINPKKEDINTVKIILETFRNVSGLCINMDKSSVHSIRCEDIDFYHVLLAFFGTKDTFPCHYLGLQLHYSPLHKVYVQPS